MKSLPAMVRFVAPLGIVLLSATGCSSKQLMEDTNAAQLLRMPYVSVVDQLERDYFLYLPAGYDEDASRDWPVIVYLHGDGDRGDGKQDLDFLLSNGPLYETWIQKRDLPFIIIAPQNHMFGRDGEDGPEYLRNRSRDGIPTRLEKGVPERPANMPAREWFGPMRGSVAETLAGDDEDDTYDFLINTGWRKTDPDAITILDSVLANHQADPTRVYMMGTSMGGFGVCHYASQYPEKFAAIVPVVGFPLMDQAEAISRAKIPVWAFSGGRDPAVPTEYFFDVMNRIEELGSVMRFTTEQDMFHDVWNRVYAGEDVYNWLLQFNK